MTTIKIKQGTLADLKQAYIDGNPLEEGEPAIVRSKGMVMLVVGETPDSFWAVELNKRYRNLAPKGTNNDAGV